jgi:hypothetical protein
MLRLYNWNPGAGRSSTPVQADPETHPSYCKMGTQSFLRCKSAGKDHTDQMISKLRSMFHISNINSLKSIYFAYFHSIIKCGIILGGNSSNSMKIFTLQNKIIRIMVGTRPRTPCKVYLKMYIFLPVPFQYNSSLMNFFVNNQENFQTNS